MQLLEFNQASANQIQSLLQQCVHIESWAQAIEQNRPFTSKEALLDFAQTTARAWTWDEISAALATHPRIGEKQAAKALSEKEQAFSDQEQAALSADEEIQQALLLGNQKYEKKFDFIFLIRAAGRNSEEILTALNYRLKNDMYMERRIVHQQLLEIALLRLEQEVSA